MDTTTQPTPPAAPAARPDSTPDIEALLSLLLDTLRDLPDAIGRAIERALREAAAPTQPLAAEPLPIGQTLEQAARETAPAATPASIHAPGRGVRNRLAAYEAIAAAYGLGVPVSTDELLCGVASRPMLERGVPLRSIDHIMADLADAGAAERSPGVSGIYRLRPTPPDINERLALIVRNGNIRADRRRGH